MIFGPDLKEKLQLFTETFMENPGYLSEESNILGGLKVIFYEGTANYFLEQELDFKLNT